MMHFGPLGPLGAQGMIDQLDLKMREQQQAQERAFSLPEEDTPVPPPPDKGKYKGQWRTFRRWLIRLGVLSPFEDER